MQSVFGVIGRFLSSLVPTTGTATAARDQPPVGTRAAVGTRNPAGRTTTRLADGDSEWEDYDGAFAQSGGLNNFLSGAQATVVQPTEESIVTLTVSNVLCMFQYPRTHPPFIALYCTCTYNTVQC